ncbi:hypothetical protein NW757_004439 [Fusarium falciforme]|nr:hypothetical protein NW757_004439 [Fusarium falciforme]
MALGASIVFGVGSSDGNGFRKLLRDQLRFSGYKVDMVGTKNGGTMKDNDVEATSGFIVKQIHDASKLSYKYKPNLVVINAGTNDIVGGIDPAGQPQRLKSMLLDLWSNISPETVIIVSTILPVDKPAAEALRGGVNNGYRDVVSDLYKEGKPIYLADLGGFMTLSDLGDGTHPTDFGFRKMAGAFWSAIQKAEKENKLKDPLPADTSNDGGKTCRKSPGDGVNAGSLTQRGSGYDDGTYEHDSQEMGALLTITSDWDRDQWFFARIFRSDRDDLLGWVENSAGNGGGDKPPSFVYKGLWRAADSRFPQAKVRLADIDGDGRADFCGLSDNGDVYVWRNGWINDMPEYWQALGKRFNGKGMGNLDGTRFEDLNGDGRDDRIWVGDKGEAHTWTNSRSCGVGKEGDGLKVAWRPGYYKGKASGPTHAGGFASGIRNRIHFARIYGEPQDFGLLGKLDYVYMEHTKGSNRKHTFRMRVWKNKGYGATKPKADGNKYCDMTGNGRDDYVWVLSKGEMDFYPNGGKNFITGQESYWGPMQKAFFKPDRDLDRRDLHLTDWDGDGKCDIVWVDPNNQNRVSVWRNNYTPGGDFNWQYLANPAPELGRSDYLCIEKNGRIWGWTQDAKGAWTYIDQFFGSKKHDRANMRFADVDGDGRDDAIWVEKFSGDAFVYYNMGRRDIAGSRYWWEIQERGGPFPAYGGSYAGSCQYFPDLNGDGRADLHSIQGTFPNTAVSAYNVCDGNRSGDDSTDIKKPDLIMPPEAPSGGGGGEESNTPPNPGENCGLPQKWMQLPIKVGESDGGEDMCFAKWNQGVFPREIEAWASEGSLRWIRMVYNDGTQVTAGKKPAADKNHRYGTVKWDPWHDSFDKFSLYAGGFKNGVGRMVLELSDTCGSDKCSLDAGAYWPGGPPPEVDVPRGEKRDGMLLGFRLRAGDIIDSLTPLFSKSKPVKVTLRDAKFSPTWQELNARPFDGRQMEVIEASHVLFNNRDEEPVDMAVDLFLTVETGTKVTWAKEKGHEDGGEVGATIGAEYSWEAGIPEVAVAQNKKKIEVTAKYVGKQIRRTVDGGETSEFKRVQSRHTLMTKVKAGGRAFCQVVAVQSKMDIEYKAVLTQHFENGDAYSYPVFGRYRESQATDAYSNCFGIDEGDEDDKKDADSADIVITESGTYCPDGERVGDTGMSDAELLNACPI